MYQGQPIWRGPVAGHGLKIEGHDAAACDCSVWRLISYDDRRGCEQPSRTCHESEPRQTAFDGEVLFRLHPRSHRKGVARLPLKMSIGRDGHLVGMTKADGLGVGSLRACLNERRAAERYGYLQRLPAEHQQIAAVLKVSLNGLPAVRGYCRTVWQYQEPGFLKRTGGLQAIDIEKRRGRSAGIHIAQR